MKLKIEIPYDETKGCEVMKRMVNVLFRIESYLAGKSARTTLFLHMALCFLPGALLVQLIGRAAGADAAVLWSWTMGAGSFLALTIGMVGWLLWYINHM